jgi:glyoxylate reductase
MPDKKKVFITRRLTNKATKILENDFDLERSHLNEPLSNTDLEKSIFEYDAILSTVCDKFDHDLLSSENRRVEVISNYAVGLDNIDLEAAKKNRVFVYNTPGVVTDSTADMTMALMLSSMRKIEDAQNFIKEDMWNSWDPEIFLGTEMRGKTLGIIGFGRIGQAVATRAKSFGLKILYYNRSKKTFAAAFSDAKYSELDELLEKSDVISIHLPLTEKTKSFIGINQFRKMRRRPYFINTSRGDIVSNDGLDEALRENLICAAAIDVIDGEPISSDHMILAHKNCIVIPHIGTATHACRENMARVAAMNIVTHYDVRNRVEKVFKSVMNQDFCIDSDMYNTGSWDSLRHIVLLTELETELGIEFEHCEVSTMVNGYSIIKGVVEHVHQRGKSSTEES